MSIGGLEEVKEDFRLSRGPELLDAPSHPTVARLHAYLEQKRQGRPFTDRGDIRPAEIAPLLPHLVVLDVLDGGNDFRVRIWGTALVELMREERTGQLLSEFGREPRIPTDATELRRRWLTVSKLTLKRREAIFFRSPTVSPERAFMTYHGMFMPLTAGNAEIGQIFGIMVSVLHTGRQK
ncbi:MAG: PAS domain-containing protein [Parvibaculum sp.]|uniref:PAS domain-containing protein n=1 Tax=Parvibaculum sp. TaxID=2024848 RepID=UPI003C72453B